MSERETPPFVEMAQLTLDYAQKHAERIAELANEVPGFSWDTSNVLAEELQGQPFSGKWDHSLMLTDKGRPFCVAIGAERAGIGERPFATDSIHLSLLACDRSYKGNGYGRRLLREFLARALLRGYLYNSGALEFSLVTDAAAENEPVRRLYERHGFQVVGYRPDGETHVVMRATPVDVETALEGSL